MEKIDILFIHRGRELAQREDVLLSPIGTFYIADYLDKHGISVRMLNWPLLRYEAQPFDLDAFLKDHHVTTVALDLHWHPQSASVIEFARQLKGRYPQISILTGGNTAGFFAKEIMEGFPCIDFLVRGDAELPLLECARRLKAGVDDFAGVPNLVWRRRGELVFNPQSYVCSLSQLQEMEYPRFDLLINDPDIYMTEAARFFVHRAQKMIFYNPGRGCPGACQFCGGGAMVQDLLYKRKGLLWPSLLSVRKIFRDFQKKGIECLYLPFCCPPVEGFYTALFKGFHMRPLEFDLFLEVFNLPSAQLVRALAKAVLGEVTVVLSPDTGNEELRREIKSFPYSNRELVAALDLLEKNKIRAKLFFSSGFAGETSRDYLKTTALVRYLKQRFPVEFDADTIELEPGSPLYFYPEKFGIRSSRANFSDFMSAAKSPAKSIGYDTLHFKDAQIIENCVKLERECMAV